ncbi:MAG TPA: hypothetical protein VHC92_11785 [Rhodanobacteraceae bacterium]|jgi:hypothetical protein|nr:hypothetical protein [Rhodanobacteraceae bacterium]
MRSARTIAFDYTASRTIACASLAMSLAAAAAPWLSALPLTARFALSFAAIAAGFAGATQFLRPRFQRIALQESGWTLVDATGVEHAATLASHARLGDWLSLDFRLGRRRRFRLLLGPDNAPAEIRRRLVVLLARAEISQPA